MNNFHILSVDGSRFYTDHYLKVRRHRESNGLTTTKDFMYPDNGRIEDHHLLNKEFEKNGKRYWIFNRQREYLYYMVVESVHKHWYMGWYELAVARQVGTKSHGTFMIKSHNCKMDVILEAIEENEREIKWI